MQCVQRGLSHQTKSTWTARFTDSSQAQRDRQDTATNPDGIWYLATASLLAALVAGEQAWK